MSALDLAGAVMEIINKKTPTRKEDAINELGRLEQLLGRALKENEDLLASQIRKRMKELRHAFKDIE
jgi:muramoyltetrapeptide carboxypeptidase LdcA involved in peptidoglycan recycling